MVSSPFAVDFGDLPSQLPIFPLANAVLLPGGQLPLNIFEPRYLEMCQFALTTPTRMIGMIQPSMQGDKDDLFTIGCAGRISYFQETDDNRLMISLDGICRFRLDDDVVQDGGFRLANVRWDGFAADMIADDMALEKEPLLAIMRRYFEIKGFDADWDNIERAENVQLLTTLAMVCPFDVSEKQALLEAETLKARADLLMAMMEMAIHGDESPHESRH
ncbi:LON peptidase substrate-binding domain-containing protein [Candidatus Puniceispirillum sp.]|uniref:LON peptidase substrate-binding domain-containing protein n=1 Tax=Candidatus Puniceispirillum sp. TaxID=2026719 RepID=UPI003F69AD07